MPRHSEPRVKVSVEQGGILRIDRTGVSKPKPQRVTLLHVNADKVLGICYPMKGRPVIVPLFFNEHARGIEKEVPGWREDTLRAMKSEKSGRVRQAWDRDLIAHHGNQDRIYTTVGRLSRKGKGNISKRNLEYYGVPDRITELIARGNAKIEIRFLEGHKVDLRSGRLKYLLGKDIQEFRLSEEELARLLLALDQISIAQINMRAV